MKNVPKIYLAGPDVFFKNASRIFDVMEEECEIRGMIGLRPSDGGLSRGITGTKLFIAERIFKANVELIKSCDAVTANLMPFRGDIEPDSGTSFEVGMASALGKPIAGYLEQTEFFADKVAAKFGTGVRGKDGLVFDKTHGFMIEEFDMPLNLMLSCSSSVHNSFLKALDHLSVILEAKPMQTHRPASAVAKRRQMVCR